MKEFILFILLFFGLSLSLVPHFVQAQNAPLTPQQVDKIAQEVAALQRLLATTTGDSINTSGGVSGRSWSDVADKALDMLGGSVATVAATVEKAAPHVWRIMIRQQYAYAAYYLFVPWGIFAVFLVYYKYVNKIWRKPSANASQDSHDLWHAFAKVIPILVMIIIGVIGVVCTAEAAMYVINPEYYAIKDILGMVLK